MDIPLTPSHVAPLTIGPIPYWPWTQHIPAGYVPAPVPQVITTGKITITEPCDCHKPYALRPSDV